MNNVKTYEFGGRVIETIVPTGATLHAYNPEFGCVVYFDGSDPDVTKKWTGLGWRKWSNVSNCSTPLSEKPFFMSHSNHISQAVKNPVIYIKGKYQGD